MEKRFHHTKGTPVLRIPFLSQTNKYTLMYNFNLCKKNLCGPNVPVIEEVPLYCQILYSELELLNILV